MPLCQLTTAADDTSPIFINPKHVVLVRSNSDEGSTFIKLATGGGDGYSVIVTEPVDIVVGRLSVADAG